MKLEVLIGGLDNPQPAVRLDVVRVLGMLDEVRALSVLRERYQAEPDPTVRSAIAWAGKRLYQAQQAGYSTIDELFQYFGIDREIENTPDATEAELLKKMQEGMDADLIRMKQRSNLRQAGITGAAVGVGMAVGGMMGTNIIGGAMMAGAGAASSNLGPRPQIGTQRTPATKPSNDNIDVWLRRLRSDPSPGTREKAAIELASLNNPAALPHLAAAFMNDSSPQVRQSAQKFGKVLYWSVLYWEMEQDGSLAVEMQARAQKLGKNVAIEGEPAAESSSHAAAPPPPPPQPSVDVSEILRKAKAGRARRKKR